MSVTSLDESSSDESPYAAAAGATGASSNRRAGSSGSSSSSSGGKAAGGGSSSASWWGRGAKAAAGKTAGPAGARQRQRLLLTGLQLMRPLVLLPTAACSMLLPGCGGACRTSYLTWRPA